MYIFCFSLFLFSVIEYNNWETIFGIKNITMQTIILRLKTKQDRLKFTNKFDSRFCN